jgi:hypothetical protein
VLGIRKRAGREIDDRHGRSPRVVPPICEENALICHGFRREPNIAATRRYVRFREPYGRDG